MMGRKNGQLRMNFMDIGELIPENHLLRKINENIDFDFIYEKAETY
jgi:transposase